MSMDVKIYVIDDLDGIIDSNSLKDSYIHEPVSDSYPMEVLENMERK